MKLAFIGGNGHHYLKGALEDDNVQVDAVAFASDGQDAESARKKAKQFGDVQWFDDPVEMMDAFKPDAVNIGAIYAYNGDLVVEALKRNIPTVSDKPIAATWEQLESVKSAASESSAPLVTEFDFRSRPEFRAARQAVRDGAIGKPALATAQKSYRFGTRPPWYADRAQYGGTILWIASHGIDAIRFVTEQRLIRAFGMQGNVTRPDYGAMEDHTASMFELEGGGTGIVHADFLRAAKATTHGDDRLRIVGSTGQLEVRDGKCELITSEAGPTDITGTVQVQPIYVEILAALRGESTDLFGTEASLELATVLLAARDAADGRRVVDISQA